MKFMVKTQDGLQICQHEGFYKGVFTIYVFANESIATYKTEKRTTEVFAELELWLSRKISNTIFTLDITKPLLNKEISEMRKEAIFTFPKE